MKLSSWGNIVNTTLSQQRPTGRDDIHLRGESNLPGGFRRSYGTSCLPPEGGTLYRMTRMRRLLEFDREQGVIDVESGISLKELLQIIIPAGWFLPVVPGTGNVSVGGAIANDIHGKNHHKVGSFGNHITSLTLLRSDGVVMSCSESIDPDMFRATIGGMGLTGIILTARIRLIPIQSSWLEMESHRFTQMADCLQLFQQKQENWDYLVAWLDGFNMERGHFRCGRFSSDGRLDVYDKTCRLRIPFALPDFTLNRPVMRLLNALYFHKQRRAVDASLCHYHGFFHPLDSIENWNLCYGRKGFRQYQFVVPANTAEETLQAVFDLLRKGNISPYLCVLKVMGNSKPKGLLSFPSEGVTLAMDFKETKNLTTLFSQLDVIIEAAGGRLYPAKDSRIPAAFYQRSYPEWEKFHSHADPAMMSQFWQSVKEAT